MAGTATATSTLHRSRGVVALKVAVTVDAAGDLSSTFIGVGFGKLVRVLYDGGLDASASISLLDGVTGAVIMGPYVTGTEAVAVAFRPAVGISDKVGVIVTAATTAPNTNRDIKVAGKLNLLVSAGGNAETCVLKFIIDEADLGDGRPLTV